MRLALRFWPVVLVGVAAALHSLVHVEPMRLHEPKPNNGQALAVAAAAGGRRHCPAPTCSPPRPDSPLRATLTQLLVPAGAAGTTDLDAVFTRWEATSADFEPVGAYDRRRLVALHHPDRSAHELDLICELRGPISPGSLAQRYAWQAPTTDATRIKLTAETRDAVEQLFFRRFTVKLDRETCRPVSVQFTDGTGRASSPFPLETSLSLDARLARAVREPDPFDGGVVPVAHEIDRDPPEPRELPQTAETMRRLVP